jgi:ATP-binding cassette subfamily B multidrug efflux pump
VADGERPVGTETRRGTTLASIPGMPGRGPGFVGGGMMRGAPRVRPRDTRRTIARILTYFRKERFLLALIFLFTLVESVLAMAGPYLIGMGVDAIAAMGGSTAPLIGPPGTAAALAMAAGALLAAYAGGALLRVLENLVMAGVSQRMVYGIRSRLFDKMQRLPLAYYDTHQHGDIMSRLTNDVDAVSVTVSQSAVELMFGVVVVTETLAVMFFLHPLMALAAMVPIPLVFLLTGTVSRRTRALFKDQQSALGALGAHVEETITGIHAVKAFGREIKAGERFGEINERLRHSGTRAQIWAGFLMPMMNVIGNIGLASIAVMGGMLAARGLISVGLIAAFISYSRQFVRPMNEIANTYNTFMSAVAGAERVFEIMDEAEEPADAEGARALDKPLGEVEFRGVSFGYRSDVTVLHDVSFGAPAGSVTAIVGRTGAGKTTIVNLLSRFYEVTTGSILIDGIDIRSYTRSSLRRAFGVVLQDCWLFAGSVRENILYGRPDASEEEMRAAAELAGADHAIRRLPLGYDTALVESGSNLSQGQRQLIGIARAVLAKPALLVLDEATSSVDARTEVHIQQGMIALMKDRTSFIIAHRLSTIRDADTVLVVDAGRIVERGSPEELAVREGYFKKLYETQRRGIEI